MQILCPTDFSKPATDAADVAAAIGKKLNLPLRLLHCAQDWVLMGDVPIEVPDDPIIRARLKSDAERLRAGGVVVVEELRRGIASLEIIAAASEQPTKMIVLGSFGKGMAERWLIGSVTERVAEGATVPTLVVRQSASLLFWLEGDAQLRLLCGVDFTPSADTAVAAAQAFVTLGRVEIEAAFIRPSQHSICFQTQQASLQQDVWDRLRAGLGEVPITVHIRDIFGQPAAEFLHIAEERNSGLLVVGTHQRHGWQRLKTPSFSRTVLGHALTNVLCVPPVVGKLEAHIPSIRRVLLATNFSDVCTEAFRQAYSLLPSGGAIHLVHICPEPSRSINPIIASEVYFDHSLAIAEARDEAEKQLKTLSSVPSPVPGVAVTSEVLVHDDIAVAICETADRCGADVICMGTKGHSRTGIALLGSAVQGVLVRARKPVFVVTAPRS